MRFKYCIKFQIARTTRSKYFAANNPNQALMSCLKHFKNDDIKKLEIVGDPLPVDKDFAAKQIIRDLTKKKNKIKRWQAALKYQRLTNLNVYESKSRKNS